MDSAKNTRTITAVEWFASQMTANYWTDEEFNSIIEQAKQMEKRQIIDSWTDGHMLGTNGWITEDYDRGIGYYCKTFDKNYDDEI
jgi:hypothetical protein